MQVKNLKELEKVLMRMISDVLHNEVAETVKSVQVAKVQTEVYDKYPNPKKYDRRKTGSRNGTLGLQNRDNIKIIESKINKNSASVILQNQTAGDNDLGEGSIIKKYNLAYLIEYGHKTNPYGLEYDYMGKGSLSLGILPNYAEPRPFIQPTVDDLRKNNNHIDAMRRGLRKKGLDVRWGQ